MHAGLIYSLPLITVAAASAFGWMLAYLRGPIVVSGWIASFAGDDPYLIMFSLVAVFTIVGDFIEPIPAIVIFMPIVNQLTDAGSINPVHMGVVLIVTLAFGLITPPYGLSLLMASKFVGVRFSARSPRRCRSTSSFSGRSLLPSSRRGPSCGCPKHVLPESVGCFKSPAGTGYICPE